MNPDRTSTALSQLSILTKSMAPESRSCLFTSPRVADGPFGGKGDCDAELAIDGLLVVVGLGGASAKFISVP